MMWPLWLPAPPPVTAHTLPARLGTESVAPAGRIVVAEPGTTATDQVTFLSVGLSLLKMSYCKGWGKTLHCAVSLQPYYFFLLCRLRMTKWFRLWVVSKRFIKQSLRVVCECVCVRACLNVKAQQRERRLCSVCSWGAASWGPPTWVMSTTGYVWGEQWQLRDALRECMCVCLTLCVRACVCDPGMEKAEQWSRGERVANMWGRLAAGSVSVSALQLSSFLTSPSLSFLIVKKKSMVNRSLETVVSPSWSLEKSKAVRQIGMSE